jgi:hypothetical protein
MFRGSGAVGDDTSEQTRFRIMSAVHASGEGSGRGGGGGVSGGRVRALTKPLVDTACSGVG